MVVFWVSGLFLLNAEEEDLPPLIWSVEENVVWKAALPSWSCASPVVWGDYVVVLSEPNEVICLNRASGEQLWKSSLEALVIQEPERGKEIRQTIEAEKEQLRELSRLRGKVKRLQRRKLKAPKDSQLERWIKQAQEQVKEKEEALKEIIPYLPPLVPRLLGYTASTPVVDKDHLYVVLGTGAVGCWDQEGKQKWTQFFEKPESPQGYQSSPLLVEGMLLVFFNRTLYAIETSTGKEKWRLSIRPFEGSALLLDLTTVPGVVTPSGDLVWIKKEPQQMSLFREGANAIPFQLGRFLFMASAEVACYMLPSSFSPELAIRIEPTWHTFLNREKSPTSLAADLTYFYLLTQEGLFLIIDRATGKLLSEKKLLAPQGVCFSSQMVLAGGFLFISSDDGVTRVIKPGPTYDEIGRNTLEPFRSTPSFDENAVYIRTKKHLYCLEVE